jgi:predicted GIY-YIG superfamily endonuclease
MAWYVYILECSDGSYYIGHAKDINTRLEEHNSGRGAGYTRSRRPVRLLYSEKHNIRTEAVRRETQIKKWSHGTKLRPGKPWKITITFIFSEARGIPQSIIPA